MMTRSIINIFTIFIKKPVIFAFFPLIALMPLFPLFVSRDLCASSLYLDNFNDASLPTLQNGGYDIYYIDGGGPGSITYDSADAFGNSGYSLKFQYNTVSATTAICGIFMEVKRSGGVPVTISLSNYQYLTFYVRGSLGNEALKVKWEDQSGVHSPWVDSRYYLPGGQITSSWQKVVIPLTAFRYDKPYDETRVKTLHFYAENGFGTNSGTVWIDEILIASGASPVYIDTMELDETPFYTVDLDALSYDIYSSPPAPGSFSFKTNTLNTDHTNYLGSGSYRILQGRTNAAYYGQTVWMLTAGGARGINVSACDKLQFYIKSVFARSAGRGPNVHLDDAAGNDFMAMPALGASWTKVEYDLKTFGADLNLADVRNFRLSSEWVTANTNSFWVDEIAFIDTISPQAPTNIRVNGVRLTNNFSLGLENYITATVFSNEPLDPGLEAVMLEYRVNHSNWKTVCFDHDTAGKDFTNFWSAGGLSSSDRIDLRISSIDCSANSASAVFTNCRVPSSALFAFCDMSVDPPQENGLSLYTEATYYTNSIGGSGARRTFGPWASLTFDVKNSFAYQVTDNAYYYVLAVEYFDIGVNKQFLLSYDSRENLAAPVNSKEVALPKMKDTLTWKTNFTLISDAYWGNRVNGADFLIKGESVIYVRRVTLYKVSSVNSAVSLKLSADDSEMGVGTLNRLTVEAVNQFGFRDVNYSGTADLSVTGSALLSRTRLDLVNGTGSCYLNSGQEESVQVKAEKPGLNTGTYPAQFRLFYGLEMSKRVSILLGAPVVRSNLYEASPLVSASAGGEACWRTGDAPWSLMMFDIDDGFVFDRSENDGYVYDITVEYFDTVSSTEGDENNRAVILKYDGTGMEKDQAGNYVWTESEQKAYRTKSSVWKSFTFTLTLCRFANRLDGKADFALTSHEPLYVRRVSVSRRNYYHYGISADLEIQSARANLFLKAGSALENCYIIPNNLLTLPRDMAVSAYGLAYSINNGKLVSGCDFIVCNEGFARLEGLILKKAAGLELLYKDEDLASDSSRLSEERLAVYFRSREQWVKKGGDLDKDLKKVCLNVNHLSAYALFESNTGKDFLVRWENNPFSPNNDNVMDRGFLHVVLSEPARKVRVFLYNLKGAFVRELEKHQTSTGQIFEWDGKDAQGKNVPIGSYIYQVEYDGSVYNGIVGVVR